MRGDYLVYRAGKTIHEWQLPVLDSHGVYNIAEIPRLGRASPVHP